MQRPWQEQEGRPESGTQRVIDGNSSCARQHQLVPNKAPFIPADPKHLTLFIHRNHFTRH